MANAYATHTLTVRMASRSYAAIRKRLNLRKLASGRRQCLLSSMLQKQNVFGEIAAVPTRARQSVHTGSSRSSETLIERSLDTRPALWPREISSGKKHRLRRTYAPTAHMGHIRLALALAARHGSEIEQMDVCTAFLGSILHEDIHMSPPTGYTQLLQLPSAGKQPIWKLLHSLYGLKRSPCERYHTLRQCLESPAFKLSRLDRILYV